MQHLTDAQLLRAYTERGSEVAFAELVTRHAGMVYAAALRQVESPDAARDVAQSVFTDLARKAAAVSKKAVITGWLFRSTRFAALALLRTERRRRSRERQAMDMLELSSASEPDWEHLRPTLDEAINALDDRARDAILLRFFEGRDLSTVGRALGITDDAAQKCVSRALEKMRLFFARRGVAFSASALGAVLGANAVQAAPIGLGKSLAAVSLAAKAAGAAASAGSTLAAGKLFAIVGSVAGIAVVITLISSSDEGRTNANQNQPVLTNAPSGKGGAGGAGGKGGAGGAGGARGAGEAGRRGGGAGNGAGGAGGGKR